MNDFIKLNRPVRKFGRNSIELRAEIIDKRTRSYLSLGNQYDFKASFRAAFMIYWG